MKKIQVVCAIIVDQENILISKRPPDVHLANLWEFPGGKMNAGELPEEALHREINEELGVTLEDLQPVETIFFQYPEHGGKHLELMFFLCRIKKGLPRAHAATEIRWVKVDQLKDFDFPEADQKLLNKLPKLVREFQL